MYDPLHYVLLFPRGDTGWQIGINLQWSQLKMSPLLFYARRLMVREGFSTNMLGGRLLQQYVVDIYAKIETHGFSVIQTVMKDGAKEEIPMGNGWVVPYNPYLAAYPYPHQCRGVQLHQSCEVPV